MRQRRMTCCKSSSASRDLKAKDFTTEVTEDTEHQTIALAADGRRLTQ